MRHYRRVVALAALLMAAAFLVAQSDQAIGAHPCPTHGAHHAPATGGSNDHVAHQDNDSPGAPRAICTCLGACQLGASIALGAQPTGLHSAPTASRRVSATPPVSAPRLHFAHTLPYATAPPVLS
ncbi:MAG: hypothetical protein ACREMW_11160 [Gemmatimonadales bacterium]